MSIFFNQHVSPQVDSIISTSARSPLGFPNGVRFICSKLSLFSHPPTLFLQGIRCLNQVSILFMWSLFILFNQCSYPVILTKILTELQVHHPSFFFFFSGGSKSSFQCWSYSFPRVKCFLMPVHLSITYFLLFICSRVLKISQKNCVSILNQFKLFGDCYLIQAI